MVFEEVFKVSQNPATMPVIGLVYFYNQLQEDYSILIVIS